MIDKRIKSIVKKLPDGVQCTMELSTDFREARHKRKFYVCLRPGCRRYVFSPFPPEKIHVFCRHPQFQLGDGLKFLIRVGTFGIAQSTPDCDCETRRKLLNIFYSAPVPNWIVRTLQMLRVLRAPAEPWERQLVIPLLERLPESSGSELNTTGSIA